MSEKARLQSGERRTPEFFQQESQNTKVDQIQEHPRTKVQNVIFENILIHHHVFQWMFWTFCWIFPCHPGLYRWGKPHPTPPTPGERTATRTEHDFRQDLAGTSNLAVGTSRKWKLIWMEWSYTALIRVFPKIGVSQNGWLIMENPIKMI